MYGRLCLWVQLQESSFRVLRMRMQMLPRMLLRMLLWVQGKFSLSLRILTEAGVKDWEQLQNVKGAGMGSGWT